MSGHRSDPIERVGAGGQVGEGQSGAPLHKPQGKRDRELGERERVGAGGPVGSDEADKKIADLEKALQEVVEKEIARGDAEPMIEPDQKSETR
jgi:hypothetical protein